VSRWDAFGEIGSSLAMIITSGRGATLATRRTSLIIEPLDGKIPPLTPEGRETAAAIRAATQGVLGGPEDRNFAERCLIRGYNFGSGFLGSFSSRFAA
jgi:hypothetical protein